MFYKQYVSISKNRFYLYNIKNILEVYYFNYVIIFFLCRKDIFLNALKIISFETSDIKDRYKDEYYKISALECKRYIRQTVSSY